MDNNEIRTIWHAAKVFGSGLQACAACSPAEHVLDIRGHIVLCMERARICTRWAFGAAVKPDTEELVGKADIKALVWVIGSISLWIVCSVDICAISSQLACLP